MASGYVYIIDPHIQMNGKPVVKIGMTTRNPHRRLKELQTSLPHKASLVRAVRFPDGKAAERSLHKSLDTYRVRSGGGMEFFFLNSSEAVQIVNKLAYQISAWEAKAALDRELGRFSEQVSGDLSLKITKWSIAAMFVGVFAFFTIQEGNFTSGFLAVLFAALCGIWLFVGLAAHFVGDAIVRGIWGEEIKAERDRLLQKFPAAKDAV
jgi:T5orf172 domain